MEKLTHGFQKGAMSAYVIVRFARVIWLIMEPSLVI